MIYKEKIIVTGAGGLIGNELCNLLDKHKLPFIAIYRTEPQLMNNWNKEFLNLESSNSVNHPCWNNASCVIHCAASIPSEKTSIDTCYTINKQIDLNVFNAIKKNSIPMLIFLSTSSIYGFSKDEIFEDSEPSPQNLYSLGKLQSESLFRSITNCRTIFLRINAPYHPKQSLNTVLKIFIENAINNNELVFHGSGLRAQDFTAVDDIVNAIFSIISQGIKTSGEVYNVASGKPISMRDLAKLIVSIIPNTASKITPSGIDDPQENCRSIFNINKFSNEYHWKPKVNLKQGIGAWFQQIK
jgi:nucleoside-diphosphate-sugar epimerase